MDELVGVGVGVGGALECPPPPQATRPNNRKNAQIPFSMLIPLTLPGELLSLMPQRNWRKELLAFLSPLDAVCYLAEGTGREEGPVTALA